MPTQTKNCSLAAPHAGKWNPHPACPLCGAKGRKNGCSALPYTCHKTAIEVQKDYCEQVLRKVLDLFGR